MDDILDRIYQSHRLLLVLAALAYFALWSRTHVGMPRYVHVLAGTGVLVGLALLLLTPPDAPVHREPLGWVRKGAVVAVFPAVVYVCFILFGGHGAAYDRPRVGRRVVCPGCGTARQRQASCPTCGHP